MVGLYLDSVFVEGAGVGGKNVLEFFFFFLYAKIETYLSEFLLFHIGGLICRIVVAVASECSKIREKR